MSEIDIDKTFCWHLGQRIQSAREFRKLTDLELADRLNPPRKADDIRRIEAGVADVFAFELNQISMILNVPLYHFIDDGSLFWFDDRRFAEAYRILQEDARSKVRELVFALAGDIPLIHS